MAFSFKKLMIALILGVMVTALPGAALAAGNPPPPPGTGTCISTMAQMGPAAAVDYHNTHCTGAPQVASFGQLVQLHVNGTCTSGM